MSSGSRRWTRPVGVALVLGGTLGAAVVASTLLSASTGILLLRSSTIPYRVDFEGRTFERADTVSCDRLPPGVARFRKATEIEVLLGGDITVNVNAERSLPPPPTVIYAELESDCYVSYSLLGGP